VARRGTRPFWALDCETDPFKAGRIPYPFAWGLYTGSEYHEFKTGREVAEFVREHDAVVYAHNGGKFDYMYLREFVNSDEKIMVINQRLAKFKIGRCEFRDSVNLIPAPLSAFQKEKIDYAIFEADARDIPANRERIRDYLRSDCVNLWHMLDEYFREYGRGLTQAGNAMKFWQKQSGIRAPRQSAAKYVIYKPYYYGGRVECFETGVAETSFKVADINSAYPYAMLSPHPFSLAGELRDTLPENDKLHKCLVTLDGVARGSLPCRLDDGRLVFPSDEKVRRYHVTGHEIAAGLDTGALTIHKVADVHYFGETIHFREYVDHFFAIRAEAKKRGDTAQDLFAKIMLNGLYGKFGSDPEKYCEWLIATDASIAGHKAEGWERSRDWDNRFLMRKPLAVERQRYYNVATAASVTGFVRAYLWRSLNQCSGAIYCDTDSIAARDVSRLPQGPELGRWKIEMDCDRYAVAGKKLYAFHKAGGGPDEWKTACKGVNLTPAEIVNVAAGTPVAYSPMVPTYSILKPEPIFTTRLVKRTESMLNS